MAPRAKRRPGTRLRSLKRRATPPLLQGIGKIDADYLVLAESLFEDVQGAEKVSRCKSHILASKSFS